VSNILSQDEINALLAGVLEDEADPSEETNDIESEQKKESFQASNQRITKYDFRRPNVFSKDHLRIIQGYHENFARMFGASLAVYLRQDLKLYLTYIEQHIYSEYVDESDERSLYFIISYFDDQAIVSINIDIALLIIEKLLGGQGEKTNIDRSEFTEIEQNILKVVIKQMLENIKLAWDPMMKDEPKVIANENNPKLIHLLPQNDPLLKLVFELVMGEHIGIITFCIPYVSVEPLLGKMALHQPVSGRDKIQSQTEALKKIMTKVPIPLKAQLGTTELSLGEISRLGIGDVISLNTKTDESVLVNVSNIPKFKAEIGRYSKNIAVKINEIIIAETEDVTT
jgi:flagellar motor switch protein FliM